ncbi:hypothetical protein BSR29_03160 [Boudabousia liubingyangii]|uniref:Membrane transport protein MMPL domain-containing protein n=1 Tax=Boudabousia liubingyangii TaxID=1921764 RepID=A0A1Q5PMT2_9ACTO|nr:MMPL family transporter [Boudabousia liubingyangii]OKL48868.1 hypothetical protein BSR29_03160 [Boudabousia liubingyangii]
MFHYLSTRVIRHPMRFLAAWIVLLAASLFAIFGGYGTDGLFDRLTSKITPTQGTQSAKFVVLINEDSENEQLILLFSGIAIPQDLPQIQPKVTQAAEEIQKIPGVKQITNPLENLKDPRNQALLAKNQEGFALLVVVSGATGNETLASLHKVEDYAQQWVKDQKLPNLKVNSLSEKLIGEEINDLSREDLAKGELISLPVALLLLVVIFGGLIAAGLPLAGAVAAIVVSLAGVWTITFLMDVNSFVINIITIIGLALSIDYGLLIVSRFREEILRQTQPLDEKRLPRRPRQPNVAKAVQVTIQTAGRTVFYSAVTIAAAISGLFVFPNAVFKMIGYGGVLATLIAVAAALTLVPALILLSARYLIRPGILSRIPGLRKLSQGVGDQSDDHGIFSKLAKDIQKRPIITTLIITGILIVMSVPVGQLKVRTDMHDYLPQESQQKVAYEQVQTQYPALATAQIQALYPAKSGNVEALKEKLESYPGVTLVTAQPVSENPDYLKLDIHMGEQDPLSDQVLSDVRQIRTEYPEMVVGGPAAVQEDLNQSLKDHALAASGIVIGAVFILLFAMTGSLIVPLKALILNCFSLVASLGATTWLFQGGHLGLPQVVGLETFIVACVLAFGFGLSMDYEVFLVARIKEYWDQTEDNDRAVQIGLQRSGRIVTSAAVIIVAVFFGFVAGELVPIKEIGIALALTVITDATLVRMLLVPATMTIMGRWNWWAPKPLRKLHEKIEIKH